MRTGHFLRWWVGAVVLTAGAVGCLGVFGHLLDEKEGGLEVRLSNAGCLGGAAMKGASAADCSRTEWLYTHWWVWPLGILMVGLAIGAVVAIVSLATSQDEDETGGRFGFHTT